MRHGLSVVLSLILAPLIYIATGYSAIKLGEATAGSSIGWGAALLGIAGALFAGACYALLVMARLSPFGPVLAGLLYIGVTLWAVLDKAAFASSMPTSVLGEAGVLVRPVGAGTLLLAVPLLFTIFSPRRWRRSAAANGAAQTYQGARAHNAPTPDDASTGDTRSSAAAPALPLQPAEPTTAEPTTTAPEPLRVTEAVGPSLAQESNSSADPPATPAIARLL